METRRETQLVLITHTETEHTIHKTRNYPNKIGNRKQKQKRRLDTGAVEEQT